MGNKPFRGTNKRGKRDRFRERLFQQQNGLCHICGEPMTLERGRGSNVGRLFATFDHVLPHALGGTAHYTNIKLAHRKCNNARNERPLQEKSMADQMLMMPDGSLRSVPEWMNKPQQQWTEAERREAAAHQDEVSRMAAVVHQDGVTG